MPVVREGEGVGSADEEQEDGCRTWGEWQGGRLGDQRTRKLRVRGRERQFSEPWQIIDLAGLVGGLWDLVGRIISGLRMSTWREIRGTLSPIRKCGILTLACAESSETISAVGRPRTNRILISIYAKSHDCP